MTGYINEFDKNKNTNTITMSLMVKGKQITKKITIKYGKKSKS